MYIPEDSPILKLTEGCSDCSCKLILFLCHGTTNILIINKHNSAIVKLIATAIQTGILSM